MSAFGAVATISAPALKSVTQLDLIKFEIEYIVYKEKIAEVYRVKEASRQVIPASIRNCIEPVLLQSLCILGQIEGAESVEEATDDKVQIGSMIASHPLPRDAAERVRSAVDSVKYEECKKDPAGAALSFVLSTIAALDKNNVSDIVKDDELCKT